MAGGQTYSITVREREMDGHHGPREFTAGLIDKLAGRPIRSAASREVSTSAPTGGLPRAVLHPELLALKQHDVHLAHALATSRRVGSALLKAEEEEAGKLKALTDEMLSKHRTVLKPLDCQAQRDALLQCYTSAPEDVLRCSPLVDAYQACADAAASKLHARRPRGSATAAPAAAA